MFKNKKEIRPGYTIYILLGLLYLNLGWKSSQMTPNDKNRKSIVRSNYINSIYTDSKLQEANLALPVFEKALIGFLNLKKENLLNPSKNILTIIDFTKSSTTKRMWIVDIKRKKLLLNTYVAHGQGSGLDLATSFSNRNESHQTSLGFYITNETYLGKHGLSLKLDGLETGVNDKARKRGIVIHGASYVSPDFIKQTGRLGRSFGCPAVPIELTNKIINLIKNKTCLYLSGNQIGYKSRFIN